MNATLRTFWGSHVSQMAIARIAPMSETTLRTPLPLIANNLPIPSALGSLDAYIGAVHQIPVLTAEEEQSLARAFRDSDDLDAAKHLVPSHLRFVVHVA